MKAEAGRYHFYVAHGCPWAHRTLIYRALKKLEDAISVAYAIPGLMQHGWTFESNPAFPDCTPDTVNGFHYLHETYTATEPHYTGKVTVPTVGGYALPEDGKFFVPPDAVDQQSHW